MAWGSSSLRSCTSLWERLERNDPSLTDLFILPTKTVTKADWERCVHAISKHGAQRYLRSIHASGHAIDQESLQKLSTVLHETSLQVSWDELAIGDSNLGSDGVTALVSTWNQDTQIESLDLSYKSLGHTGLKNLLNWAQASKSLTKLDLSRNLDLVKGGTADTVLFSDSLQCLLLQEVNLSECSLDAESGGLVISLFASAPLLRIFRLGSNPLGQSVSTSLNRLSPSLVELSLNNCGLPDETFPRILPILCKLELLEKLDMSQNGLNSTGTVSVAKGLVDGFANLRCLNLAGNPLQSDGVATLVQEGCKLRSNNPPLASLDLSSTQCSARGAHMAIMSSQVQELRLFDNALGSEGFSQLVDTLQGGHAFLYSLDLAGNGANEDAVVKLLRGLLNTKVGFHQF